VSKYQFLINKMYKAHKNQFRREFFSSASLLQKKVTVKGQRKYGTNKVFLKERGIMKIAY